MQEPLPEQARLDHLTHRIKAVLREEMATPGESIVATGFVAAAACAAAGVPVAALLDYVAKSYAGIARKLRRGSAGHLT